MEEKNKIITWILMAYILLVIILGSMYLYTIRKASLKTNIANPYYDELIVKNKDFADGEQLIASRNSEDAIAKLESAYTKAENTMEESIIKYSLALAYSSTRKDTGKYKESIVLAKEIIANPEYPISIKALAVTILDRLLTSSIAQDAATLIADTAPYSDFFKEKNLALLRKRLLAFGESFYPLADLEMKLAALHALDLLEKKQHGDNSNFDFERKTIISLVERGDKDISERIAQLPRQAVYTPEIFLYKAIAAERLFWATGELPFGDIDTLYKKAITASETYYKPQLPLIEYYYAVFLAKSDSNLNSALIRDLLMPYDSPEARFAYMAGVFKNEKNNILGEKSNLLLLAKNDSQFRSYLESLGWETKDFLP